MPSPFVLAKWEGLLLLAGLFGIVCWKLLTGSIDLDRTFADDIRDRGPESDDTTSCASAGHVQSLLVTVLREAPCDGNY